MPRRPNVKVPFRERYRTSRAIFRQSLALLRGNRDLWMFPILAVTLMLVMIGVPAYYVGARGYSWAGELGIAEAFRPYFVGLVILPLVYPFAVLGSLFNAAMTFALHERMEGRACTRRQAWRRALGSLGALARFNLIAMAVAGIFHVIGVLLEKLRIVPVLGRVVQAAGMYAWAVAAYFVIPILVVEGERSAVGALRKSVEIARSQWGKATAGIVTLALVLLVPMLIAIGLLVIGMLVLIPLMVSKALSPAAFLPIMVGFLVAIGVLVLLASFVQGAAAVAYQTALYRFARKGEVTDPFTKETIVDAWAPYRG